MNFSRIIYLHTAGSETGLLAIGCEEDFVVREELFSELDLFLEKHKNSYLFSCFSYDLKNKIEDLTSENEDQINFPDLVLWKAELVVEVKGKTVALIQGEMNVEYEKIIHNFVQKSNGGKLPLIQFKSQISKSAYLENVKQVKNEIQQGNVYELNYCQQYLAENLPEINSADLFHQLSNLTQAPFSAYLNLENHEIFCGSPERFIQKEGEKLISQPIKGTIKRGKDDQEDELLKLKLSKDPKERAENVMITDLVRNDFSKIAQKNSVNVDELCGIYSFGTVNQMISTISCKVKNEVKFSDILKATFPMGSMTGAPKIAAMVLSEKYESFKRGLYSGSIGYIKPNGDFDFNVVIRTLIKNKSKNTFSAAVGGAITIQSDPEQEYEECQVKIRKLLDLFQHD